MKSSMRIALADFKIEVTILDETTSKSFYLGVIHNKRLLMVYRI